MSGRTYVYQGPIGAHARRRGREQHELVVRSRDAAPEVAPGCEPDGRGISRASAAWVLLRWRKSRAGIGAGLWAVGHAEGRDAVMAEYQQWSEQIDRTVSGLLQEVQARRRRVDDPAHSDLESRLDARIEKSTQRLERSLGGLERRVVDLETAAWRRGQGR